MKSKLIILLLGFIIIFSGCNPFKNLGKTKDERRTERKHKKARRLVDKAIRIDPSILHPDTIIIPGTHIDSSIHVDTSINFVDSIINRFIYHLDDRGNSSTGYSGMDIESLREWAIATLKDSILLRNLITDTITHKFLRNGVLYKMKIWDQNGKIFYDLNQGERVILDEKVIVNEATWWDNNKWWVTGLFWLIIIIMAIALSWKKLKQLFGVK